MVSLIRTLLHRSFKNSQQKKNTQEPTYYMKMISMPNQASPCEKAIMQYVEHLLQETQKWLKGQQPKQMDFWVLEISVDLKI